MKKMYDQEKHKILEFQIKQSKQMIDYLDSLVHKLNLATIFTITMACCCFFLPSLTAFFGTGTYVIVTVTAVFIFLIYLYVFTIYTRSKLEIQLKSKEDEIVS